MSPSVVVHLYLIGLPLGETAFAVSRTCCALASHALMIAVSEVKVSLSGALTTDAFGVAFGFWASAGTEQNSAATASGAAKRRNMGAFFNICTPCGETGL